MNLCSPIDERLPVWTALSQLFLDTELSLDDIVRVADLLARAPNLIAPAGEWTSWSESEVRSIMEKAERRGYLGKRLSGRPWARLSRLTDRRELRAPSYGHRSP